MFRFAIGAIFSAAVLAALPAHAEQNFYGVLDVNLSSSKFSVPERYGKGKRTQSVDPGAMTTSYVGFSGSEKLHEELTVNFVLESFLGMDTGNTDTAGFWTRNAKVGLQTGYGTLNVGRSQTIFFDTLVAFSPYGEARISPAVSLLAGAPTTFSTVRFQFISDGATDAQADAAMTAINARSWSNSLTYVSPDYDGLSVALQVGLKEGDTNGGNHGVAIRFEADELKLGYAFQTVKGDLPAVSSASNSRWVLGGSYDFAILTAYAQVGQDKYELYGGAIRSNYLQFGAKVPVSARGEVLASYGYSKNKPLDSKATILTVGYDHHLSARTDAYVNLMLDQLDLLGSEGDLGTSLTLGMRHRF